MKSLHHPPPDRGFTRTDLCAVLMAIVLLAFIALPALAKMKPHSERASCANNLRQIGIGWHSWAKENGNRPPWYVPVVDGGTKSVFFHYFHFIMVSNYVTAPAVMVCPSDTAKTPARDYSSNPNDGFRSLSRQAISYFIATELAMDEPKAIMAGDRNVQTLDSGVCGAAGLTTARLRGSGVWTNGLHGAGAGNLLFCDGAVRMVSNKGLQDGVKNNPVDPNGSGCVYIP